VKSAHRVESTRSKCDRRATIKSYKFTNFILIIIIDNFSISLVILRILLFRKIVRDFIEYPNAAENSESGNLRIIAEMRLLLLIYEVQRTLITYARRDVRIQRATLCVFIYRLSCKIWWKC